MDLQQLIQHDANGTYCILFQNKAALTMPEIQKIFSTYGKIHSVQSTGDERGYRFVRYNTYEEVKEAVDGVKDHPKIKLGYHKKNRDQKTSPNVSNDKVGGEAKFNKTSNYGQNEKYKQKKQLKYGEKKSSNNSSRLSNYSEKDSKNSSIREHLLKSDSYSKETQNGIRDLITNNTSANRETLKIENDKSVKISEDEIPNLIKVNGKATSLNMSKKRIISNAEEVVVGNIPPNFGPPYILYLFDRYEPIAITKINKLKNNIRYCNVYFKTAEDSIAVESKFDKMELSGHKLVVLRPYRLIQEALN